MGEKERRRRERGEEEKRRVLAVDFSE